MLAADSVVIFLTTQDLSTYTSPGIIFDNSIEIFERELIIWKKLKIIVDVRNLIFFVYFIEFLPLKEFKDITIFLFIISKSYINSKNYLFSLCIFTKFRGNMFLGISLQRRKTKESRFRI